MILRMVFNGALHWLNLINASVLRNTFVLLFAGGLALTSPVAVSSETHNISEHLTLSQEEIEFLKSHPVLRIHAEENWPPFNFVEYGQPKGYVNDYIRLLSEVSGLKFQFISGYSWDEYVEMLRTHEIDLISNMTITPEREKKTLFTEQGVVNVAVGLLSHNLLPNL